MKIKTLIKLTTTVALTFGFVAANAANKVRDFTLERNGTVAIISVNGSLTANSALNCYQESISTNKKNQKEEFLSCIEKTVEENNSFKEIRNFYLENANTTQAKLDKFNNVSLVDSIKQAQTTGSSFTSKQYDDYARMANVMTFASATSDESIEFKKSLRDSAVDYAFNDALKSKKPFSYQVLKDTQNQATNQAILTTLLAMSDSLNQIKNDLHSNSCITGNCTVKASTEKEVLSKLSPDELRAMALGILNGLSQQNSGVKPKGS